jgi:hypothetical protein
MCKLRGNSIVESISTIGIWLHDNFVFSRVAIYKSASITVENTNFVSEPLSFVLPVIGTISPVFGIYLSIDCTVLQYPRGIQTMGIVLQTIGVVVHIVKVGLRISRGITKLNCHYKYTYE